VDVVISDVRFGDTAVLIDVRVGEFIGLIDVRVGDTVVLIDFRVGDTVVLIDVRVGDTVVLIDVRDGDTVVLIDVRVGDSDDFIFGECIGLSGIDDIGISLCKNVSMNLSSIPLLVYSIDNEFIFCFIFSGISNNCKPGTSTNIDLIT